MSIENTLERIAAALEKIAGAGGDMAAPEAEAPKPAKTKAPTKGAKPGKSEEEVVAAAQAKARAQAEADDNAEEEAGDDEPAITKADIGKLVKTMLDNKLLKQAESLLQIHGATNLSSLDPSEYAKFAKAAQSLIDKALLS